MAVTVEDALPPARRRSPGRALDPRLGRFALLCVGGLGLVVSAGTLLFDSASAVPVAVAALAFVVAAVVAASSLRRHHPHARLGLANAVTLLRLALVSTLLVPLLVALLGGPAAPVPVVVIAIVALCLDGVDGWLARRQGLSSPFGARFDMEVDSAFGLVLAVLAVVAGGVGWWVLLLGLPRYLFGLAGLVAPWLNGPLPPRFSRKVICVVQLAVLIAVQSPWFAGLPGVVIVIAALLALAWSFGSDILWLRRHPA
ncbi:MAG: CDP-alcohol phosphatidyltransferase family protein [Microcella sp.]|uniref:CDP-alcohol phosphatidyltransferase family protein n=1 Tax=Microcella sp. TaxID=1913979 RepID=UPI003316376F